MITDLKKKLASCLSDLSQLDNVEITYPSNEQFGDFTCNMAMIVAAKQKNNPQQLAHQWARDLMDQKWIKDNFAKVEAVGPGFLNFYLSAENIKQLLNKALQNKSFGRLPDKGQVAVVEYSSPNTNKPLHVGHLRNNALGMCLVKLYDYLGYRVIPTQIINDRGIHIMKSLLAFLKWGKDMTPTKAVCKGDKLVGDFYVMFNQKETPQLLAEARELLIRWESGDKEIRKLWKKLNEWVYLGWQKTYQKYGSEFKENFYESQIYDKGRELIEGSLDKKMVQKKKDGAVVVDLSKYDLGGRESGEKVLLRADGTTVYITQDIYLAKLRYDKYNFDKMLYVVGDEQIYHFKVLFVILKILGFEWVNKCQHFIHGLVLLPEGKMKSREGKAVDADDMIEEVINLAQQEVQKRNPDLPKKETEQIAEAVGLAAIKYWFLKANAKTTILFDPKESIDFEGNTGPYLLYTYVRLQKILTKAGSKTKFKASSLGEEESELARQIAKWPLVIEELEKNMQPHMLCEYLYKLASLANSYYQKVPVLKSPDNLRFSRLAVIKSCATILQIGLDLLNIKIINKM